MLTARSISISMAFDTGSCSLRRGTFGKNRSNSPGSLITKQAYFSYQFWCAEVNKARQSTWPFCPCETVVIRKKAQSSPGPENPAQFPLRLELTSHLSATSKRKIIHLLWVIGMNLKLTSCDVVVKEQKLGLEESVWGNDHASGTGPLTYCNARFSH